ncbi:MAG: riboflavin synthase [Blastocatellia bacterium]|nr:riboflavin synthase [Blastocatellia bacterium]
MFTGIIEELGRVERLERQAAGGRLKVQAQKVLEGTRLGDSIAVNGVCLTVTALDGKSFCADLSEETLVRSSLAEVRPAHPVNLERAVAVGQRLGGHIVQGHIDGTGKFLSRRVVGDSVEMRFSFPPELGRYIALKGSIAVDGVSLTVAALSDQWFEAAVIPTTLTWTTLAKLTVGTVVNLETDVLAKYLERLMTGGNSEPSGAKTKQLLTVESLREMGY